MQHELTEAQRNFIPHLLAHCDPAKASMATGIPIQSVESWLRNPLFKSEISYRRKQLAEKILDMLGKAACDSVKRLHSIVLDCGSDQHAIKAAESILSNFQKTSDQVELASRIEALEFKARAK